MKDGMVNVEIETGQIETRGRIHNLEVDCKNKIYKEERRKESPYSKTHDETIMTRNEKTNGKQLV